MTTSAIALHGVHKSFGAVHAVRGVDLQVTAGEIVAFLGPNGAGKTTTIDMVLGLGEPDAGEVTVFGMTPREAVRRGLVSAVLQTGGLLKDITVGETVALMASLFGRPQAAQEALRRAGIDQLAGRKVGACSGGEQQRLRFALALVPDPLLVILDEPTTGMDVNARREFWSAIRQDAEEGRTVLFATHYLEEADAYADRVVLMAEGQVVADGTAAQVRSRAGGRTVRAQLEQVDHAALAVAGADHVELRGDHVIIQTGDSDTVARYLLTRTAARDVEITARGIEEAFVALTAAGARPPVAAATTSWKEIAR